MPLVVNNASSSTAVNQNCQYKFFKRKGLYYIFWADNDGADQLQYKFAPSLIDLAAAAPYNVLTNIGAGGGFNLGQMYSTYYDPVSDTLGIAWTYYTGVFYQVYFVYCRFNSNGTLDKSTEHQVGASIVYNFLPQVVKLPSGNWAVSFIIIVGRAIYVYKSNTPTPTANGNWAGDNFIHTPAITWGECFRVAPWGNNNAIVVYQRYDDDVLCYRTFTTVFSGENASPYTCDWIATASLRLSALLNDIAGNPHFIFIDKVDGYLYEGMITLATGEWSRELITDDMPALPLNPIIMDFNGHLVTVIKSNTNMYMYIKKVTGWENITDLLLGDAGEVYTLMDGSPTAINNSNELALMWLDSTGGANNIYVDIGPRVIGQFSAAPLEGDAPLTVQFTDESIG